LELTFLLLPFFIITGLQVAVKCKNVNGDYESKAVGKLDGSGAFSVPLATDLHGADCHAQLYNAAGKPCAGQEPSAIVPQSEGTFIAVPGKTQYHQQSAECASATICGPVKKHIIDHFHKKKPVPPKPKPEPMPEYHPPTPTPTYGGSTPIYHPPALKASDTFSGKIKKHVMNHFHKKPVPPKPKPEPMPAKPKPEYHPPTPEYHSPTPAYGGSPTPIYHPPALKASATFCGKIKKHVMDHFHKKPVSAKPKPEPMPPKPKPEPMPEYHPPKPEYHPPTPTYGGSTPIYHPPAAKH
jgi:hypothetical protein